MTLPTSCQCFGCKSNPGVQRRYVLVCGGCAAVVDETARLRRNAGERRTRSPAAPRAPRLCETGCGRVVRSARGARYCPECFEARRREWIRVYSAKRRRRLAASRSPRLCGCGKPVRPSRGNNALLCEACEARRLAAKRVRLSPVEARERSAANSRRSMAKLRADPAFRERERIKTRDRMRARRARLKSTNQMEAIQ